jgi:hypothetical protein
MSVKAIGGRAEMANPGKTYLQGRSPPDGVAIAATTPEPAVAIGLGDEVCVFWLFPRPGGPG